MWLIEMTRILIAAIHYPVCSARYIARAFKRLGHDVRTIGPVTGNNIWGMEVDARWAWEPDYDPAQPGDWLPELIVIADSGYYLDWKPSPETPRVLWGVDNHSRNYTELGQQFDAMFLAHSWAARMDEPNATWLPPCYDPVAHTDLGLERDIDVALIGFPYDARVEIVQAMQAAGLKVFAALGLLWGDYNALYNRAKIALVKSIYGDIPQRFFENLAQGCCVLSDPARDLEKMGYVMHVHYAPYDSALQAAEKARWLLEHDRWANIASVGRAKARGETWDARAERLLQVCAEKRLMA